VGLLKDRFFTFGMRDQLGVRVLQLELENLLQIRLLDHLFFEQEMGKLFQFRFEEGTELGGTVSATSS
jgi:hypothetical protein